MKNLYIFSMVKKDAMKYISSRRMKKIKWSSSVTYNSRTNPKGRRLIGTDIDEAYWNIAYKMGIISENTFRHGLMLNDKRLLVASLSTLGRDKRYVQMRSGRFTQDSVVLKGNDDLKNVYKKIRFTCYGYMKKLAGIIGNDFVAYKTDCIYYLHSPENVRKVKKFLEDRDIEYKMVRDWGKFTKYIDD